MTDGDKKDGDLLDLELEDDLHWDDALKEWEEELERAGILSDAPAAPEGGTAAAAPIVIGAPGKPLDASSMGGAGAPQPPQPLYRPADRGAGETRREAGDDRPSSPGSANLFDDDDAQMMETRISQVPEEVTAALSTPGAELDIDLDDLLDGLKPDADADSKEPAAVLGGLMPDEPAPSVPMPATPGLPGPRAPGPRPPRVAPPKPGPRPRLSGPGARGPMPPPKPLGPPPPPPGLAGRPPGKGPTVGYRPPPPVSVRGAPPLVPPKAPRPPLGLQSKKDVGGPTPVPPKPTPWVKPGLAPKPGDGEKPSPLRAALDAIRGPSPHAPAPLPPPPVGEDLDELTPQVSVPAVTDAAMAGSPTPPAREDDFDLPTPPIQPRMLGGTDAAEGDQLIPLERPLSEPPSIAQAPTREEPSPEDELDALLAEEPAVEHVLIDEDEDFGDPTDLADVGMDLGGATPAHRATPTASEAVQATPRPTDAGAQTAERTVRYRKPRQESFPLVGTAPEALRARRELLVQLGDKSEGPTRARLLVAAAELCEQVGEADQATDLYARAREADPHDVVALRALRRDALHRGDYGEVASLLEVEAGLALSANDRAQASVLLAEIQLTQLGDAEGAHRSARAALLLKATVPTCLLMAEASFTLDRPAEAWTALEKAAEIWNDGRAQEMLLREVARAIEQMGQTQRAEELYQAAVERDPSSVASRIGLARCARSKGDVDGAVASALQAAELVGEGPAGEALLRSAARLLHVVAARPAEAVAILGDATGVLALRARAEAAAASGDQAAHQAAAEVWASASGGTERALALVSLAEVRAARGDLDGADVALRDAALADETLGTIRVVREVLARGAGDTSRLARAMTDGDATGAALAAAAKLARDPEQLERERELLALAQEEGTSPVAADVLALDAAVATHDEAAVLSGLRREVERSEPTLKVGPLLAMAERAAHRGDLAGQEVLLREAKDVAPGDPLVLHPLANALASRDSRDAAALWLSESASTTGARSAFAATMAGRLLDAAGNDPAAAYRRALDGGVGYGPAVWALEPIARVRGDSLTLAEVNESQAEIAIDPAEVAGRLIRAAFLRAGDDPPAAAALLSRARDACPDDTIIYELMLRLGQGMATTERATLMQMAAEGAPPALARASRMRAAVALEESGEPAEAAAIYRAVLADHEGDPVATRALDRAELGAGEIARVAERRFAAVRDAADDGERVRALQQLADIDLYERQDAGAAVLSLQSILEVAPGHLPSLRALERYFMEHSRDDDLGRTEEALVAHLKEPPDVAGHARMAARLGLAAEEAPGNAADDLLLSAFHRTGGNNWLSRRALGAAEARGDLRLFAQAYQHIVESCAEAAERAALAVPAAEALDFVGETETAIRLLREANEQVPSHPAASEALARLLEENGDPAGAADMWERAAAGAVVPRHLADLWYRAGVLWQEQVGDLERAVAAFGRTADLDTTYLDVFDRLRRLRQDRGDLQELAQVTEQRIAAGGDASVLGELHETLASLREQLGDRPGARKALRATLALEPDRADALRRLAELSLQDRDWRGAAEALIRIARLRKDREELRWVFFTLGDIYDEHMPDARRAEAAYRRVLKLAPTDLDAMERLANLYERDGNQAGAMEMLKLLAEHEMDPDKSRDFRVRLAKALEAEGDPREAEAVLEQTRRVAPTDPLILRALAELYQRQNAASALSMHLNRAISDFRHALATDATDGAAWHGLVDMLNWRGRADPARACASAAVALGISDPQISALLDASGSVPGSGSAAADPDLDDLLSPRDLSTATRAVFRLAADALERVVPFDLKALHAEKASRDNPFRKDAAEVGRWFGVSDVQIWVTQQAPRVCAPISGSPTAVLLGSDLAQATEAERRFLLARAIKIAHSSLAVAVRSQPEHLALALAGLARSCDPNYAPAGIDPAQLEDAAKRVAKAVHRRARDELVPLVLEMVGSHDYDPLRLGLLVSELGDRVGLLVTGSVPAGINALLRLAGATPPAAAPPATLVELIKRVPEASAMMDFAMSEMYFEARQKTGADRL